LAIPPFDYVGLGHLHRYQNLNESGHPAVVYSGSLERIDFGERHEEKGYCLVTIHDKTKTTHEFIKVPIRQFLQIDINLHENKGQTDQIIDAVKQKNLDNAIVKIVYRLPANAQDKVDTRAIQNVCEKALHVIGIFPVHQLVTREQRVAVHEDMSLETVMKLYLASKQMPSQRIEQLVQKTLLLEEQTKG
jgi:exonuclease SbcD